jgi:cellulose biosynthesis protein BcsQ
MSKRLVVFNHKGGVSKTTTVYNIGWMLAKTHRVLVVDGDPQCNLSSLILGDDFEKYYLEDDTKLQNIKDGVKPAFSGSPYPITPMTCYSPARANNLFLLAGHANLSEYDAALTFAQTSNNAIATLQNLPGAFHELIRLTEEKYEIDYTIIDLNPGLSAINQNLFLNSDAFIIPTNPDPFSVMAIQTLTTVLPRWAEWKSNAIQMFSDSAYPLSSNLPKFCGSLIQRFNIRNGKAAKPYRDNIQEIKEIISTSFFNTLSRSNMVLGASDYPYDISNNGYCLEEIPDFQGLLPKSHTAGVPVYDLTNAEIAETGPVLAGMQANRQKFYLKFEGLVNKLRSMLNHA